MSHCSALTAENSEELIEFAKAHTTREVERRICSDAKKKLEISLETADPLRRAQDLNAQASLDEVLKRVLGEYLNRNDPSAKTKRAQRPAARGGTNKLTNLTTLCSDHHALVHQLGSAIDGQVNWLRVPQGEYQIEFVKL
jgi:hypothetical protein